MPLTHHPLVNDGETIAIEGLNIVPSPTISVSTADGARAVLTITGLPASARLTRVIPAASVRRELVRVLEEEGL